MSEGRSQGRAPKTCQRGLYLLLSTTIHVTEVLAIMRGLRRINDPVAHGSVAC